jgi:hypothetical protein
MHIIGEMWFMLLHRKGCSLELSTGDLDVIHASILDFSKQFNTTIAPRMPRKRKTIKFHKQAHAVECLQLFGNLSHVHAQFMEARHHQLKVLYSATNKQGGTYMQQMVKKQRI